MRSLEWTNRLVINALEVLFSRWGRAVAGHPVIVLVLCLFLTALSGIGFFNFSTESQADVLWVPHDSIYRRNKDWLDLNFPRTRRQEVVLFEARDDDNILTREALLKMLEVHEAIAQVNEQNVTWSHVCFRVPIANLYVTKKRRRRQTGLNSTSIIHDDWSSDYDVDYYQHYEDEEDLFEEAFTQEREEDEFHKTLPANIYCDLVATLNDKCLETSILELWKFDRQRIEALSTQDIIDDINRFLESPVYGFKFDFAKLLGSITRNESGHVIKAKAAVHVWHVEIDLNKGLASDGAGIELELADADTLAWEDGFLRVMLNFMEHNSQNLSIYPNAGRSYNDISSAAIVFDGYKLLAGYIIMFFYTIFMLDDRIDWVHHRFWLTVGGMVAIIMGIVIAFGLSSAVSLPYTPISVILPFLCLGIGIDDMFVVVQCWNNLDQSHEDLVQRVAKAMQHAGVAMTVTSLTDVFAFGVGAVTIMPALRGFCISCAIGVFVIYLLQTSWFVALLTLDQKRIRKRRDGILFCCIRHEVASGESKPTFGFNLMLHVAEFLQNGIVKCVILVMAASIFGVGIWGCLSIRQEMDLDLFLPSESYLRQQIRAQEQHFPQNGHAAEIYFGPFNNLQSDLEHLEGLITDLNALKENQTILREVDSWWSEFVFFLEDAKNITDWTSLDFGSNQSFYALLSDFLFTRRGSKYSKDFRFDDELECNQPAPSILASKVDINYVRFNGPEEHLKARQELEHLISSKNFSSLAFSFAKVYAIWEADDIIGFELWRNLALAMVCILIITLILLADLRICFFVLICVVLTMVDVVGMVHFWGLTIEVITTINIILAVGLCVDYSAHVAYAFLSASGSKQDRSKTSVVTMGRAIINGGLTTFLALVVLAFSKSHAYVVFFKIFTLTVFLGLFHGILFLPVILSILGPDHLRAQNDAKDTQERMSSFSNQAFHPEN